MHEDRDIVFCGDFFPARACVINCSQHLIGNLECSFSDSESVSDKAYTSILPLSYLDCMQSMISSFCALNLANNHTNDAGNFAETYSVLRKKFPTVSFFGTAENPYAELVCGKLKIAVIGCLERCRSRGNELFPEEKVLSCIRDLRNDYHKIFVYPHWGKECEFTRYPAPRQVELARKWIDAGADGVFGHHAHVYQGMEIYKGKPIYYSLGNFFFPHPESALHDGTLAGLSIGVNVEQDSLSECFFEFSDTGPVPVDQKEEKEKLDLFSHNLQTMTSWSWRKEIGAFYIRKNLNSWRIRIRKNPLVNLPKFVVWCLLPETLLFLIAGRKSKANNA